MNKLAILKQLAIIKGFALASDQIMAEASVSYNESLVNMIDELLDDVLDWQDDE